MRPTMKKAVFVLLSVLLLYVVANPGISCSSDTAEGESDLPTGTFQVSFIELGSVNCIPCKEMQPVMKAVEKEYDGKVKVVFHDVWTSQGRPFSEKYGIRLIPTQVFIDRSGKEIARHEGFFSKEEIEKVLNKAGVQK
jgi:thioredoxin 1